MKSNIKYYFIILVIFFFGTWLRIDKLGDKPLWVDEVLHVINVQEGSLKQDYIPQLMGHIFGTESEFFIRLPFALFGSLSILAVYFVVKDKKAALYVAGIIAITPLFVFWSKMARPYAMAGLFIVLGWRWWGFYILGLLTTPWAILGLNFTEIKIKSNFIENKIELNAETKKRLLIYLGLIILAIILFEIRDDSERGFFNAIFIWRAKRLWYIPILSFLLHLSWFNRDRLSRLCRICRLAKSSESGLLHQ